MKKKMNKTELVKTVAAASGVSIADANKAVSATFDMIAACLQNGQQVSIQGFGTFMLKERKARIGHNPRTQEKLTIPAKRAVKFQPSRFLDNFVDNKSDHGK